MKRILSSIFNSDSVRMLFKLAYFIPILVFIFLVDIYVDPGKVFVGEEYARGMAAIVASGKNIGNYSTTGHDRMFRKYTIEAMSSHPDIVVIGSSRTAQIGKRLFPNRNFVNNWVMSASLPDYLGLIYQYDKKDCLPKTLIIGIDPWTLGHTNSLWVPLYPDAQAMARKLNIQMGIKPPFITPYWENLFSLTYFQYSMTGLFSKDKIGTYVSTTEDEENGSSDIVRNDGELLLGSGHFITPEELKRRAISEVNNRSLRYTFEFKPDQDMKNAFEKLLGYLKSRGVEVVLFYPPFQEDAYKKMVADKSFGLIEMDRYYHNVARLYGIKIIGSADPRIVGLGENDFGDSFHPKREFVEKIFQQEW